jgi:hypothetical protein
MTDNENFKKVINELIGAPKEWRLCLTYPGQWYNPEKNKTKKDILFNLDWAVRELVGKGDYALAVWGSCPEIKEAWFEFHERMAKHYIEDLYEKARSA